MHPFAKFYITKLKTWTPMENGLALALKPNHSKQFAD